jgi:O-antigen ligase
LLITSLLATKPERAMQEWIKLIAMCVIAITLCRALMNNRVAIAFGTAMVISGIGLGILIVITYVKYMGFTLPSYSMTRVFKAAAMDQAGLPLNPLAFECVFTFLSGMCLLRDRQVLWWIGGVLLLFSSTLTGSRAPLAVFVLSCLTFGLLQAVRSQAVLLRAGSLLFVLALTASGIAGIAIVSPQQLSRVTEGRWEIWSVATHKFTMHPLWGNGYESVQDDPSYIVGGYHNEYLTALAEQGLIGFSAVMYLFGSLLSHCYHLAINPLARNHNGQIILFTCLFLMFRALVELPGLFGTAQGPADFLAYIFLAIAMSRTPDVEPQAASAKARISRTRLPAFFHPRAGKMISSERPY